MFLWRKRAQDFVSHCFAEVTPRIYFKHLWHEGTYDKGRLLTNKMLYANFKRFFYFLQWVEVLGSSFCFLFLAVPCSMQDLSSPTRDRTRAPTLGARSLNPWATRADPGSFSKVTEMCMFYDLSIHSARADPGEEGGALGRGRPPTEEESRLLNSVQDLPGTLTPVRRNQSCESQ